MKILACYNMKGGVGKTTSAVNLAYLSAQSGQRTLLWDLDPQGAATFHFGADPLEGAKLKKMLKDKKRLGQWVAPSPYAGLEILPAGFDYRHLDLLLGEEKKGGKKLGKALKGFQDSHDLVYLDCPPSISALSEAVFHIADHILMPMVPLELSRKTYHHVKDYLAEAVKREVDIIPFFNMADRRRVVHRQVMKDLRAEGGFCEQLIPRRADFEKMGLQRKPVGEFASGSDAALAFSLLHMEIMRRIGLG